MLQNPCKTFGFKKNIQNSPWGGGGAGNSYPASGLKRRPFDPTPGVKGKSKGKILLACCCMLHFL